VIVICNYTPVPQLDYRLGVPEPTDLVGLLSGDDARFGASGLETQRGSLRRESRLTDLPSPFAYGCRRAPRSN